MNFDELYTLLIEVESVINSSPLTHVFNDTPKEPAMLYVHQI